MCRCHSANVYPKLAGEWKWRVRVSLVAYQGDSVCVTRGGEWKPILFAFFFFLLDFEWFKQLYWMIVTLMADKIVGFQDRLDLYSVVDPITIPRTTYSRNHPWMNQEALLLSRDECEISPAKTPNNVAVALVIVTLWLTVIQGRQPGMLGQLGDKPDDNK